MSQRPIYLDYQATTPVDPRVLDAMWPYFAEHFGNPHSVHHAYGRKAEAAVEQARTEVAALIGAEPREVVFTSGATESNNTAIKGAAHFHAQFDKKHIVTAATEHKCVLESCKRLESEGFEVTYLPVRANGLVDPDTLASAMREDTVLVSIMAVNNEIGVIQPLSEIGALCRERGVYFHTDAAQAVGKIPLDVREMNIDLLSISGHKVYGPKGIGALYIRRRPRARIQPLIDGGGQERAMRSGTVPVPLAVGLGTACRVAGEEMAGESARLCELRDRLLRALRAQVSDLRVNGDMDARIPGNLNVTLPGIEAEALIEKLDGVAVSTASACSSASVEPSYVLSALGLPDSDAAASLRIGLGRFTTAEEIDSAVAQIAAAANDLLAEGTVERPARTPAAE
ncbi:IscS subfamily cysteine desulfurase [Ferruginivarius sediminum]|uniref:Cysteine desulfurase IscS n=1 Tax=Ferruginivarius sediminum TaxID=2661937 RepID=A0A369T7T4_9PROT|nr:IscS subfamily cysteine desulfurase [Ferruginivarius sediminum]RDD61338.1 IscS subfamily cysteine desulfurase [Ferruginivarius sediminum]